MAVSKTMEKNGKMSQRQEGNVSEIVEKYIEKYPNVPRKVLRKLILSGFKEINNRTLDRHLKKAFEKPSRIPESPSKIPKPTVWELMAFKQIPRDPFDCSLAEDHLKSNYPEWYRRNKKTFDEIRGVNWGFDGYITNPHPRKHKVRSKR